MISFLLSDGKLAFVDNACENFELILFLMFVIMFTLVVVIFFCVLLRKIIINYEDMQIQNKALQRDLELNSILKHEYIQGLFCPYELKTFNNEHVYITDKCLTCNKQCKKACWTQYYIDKCKVKE